MNKILVGDCLEVLKTLEDNSVDSIVTDPPYELGFMGKSWDNTGIANNPELWKECLRVLKPGGHLLAFSGTRTYHRMAGAIEDAGFEVRDMIEWVYGSGFPKSLNIGKAVDKLQGNEREVVGKILQPGSTNKRIAMGNGWQEEPDLTKGTSEWEGWGTALKPAHEPICMARKPLAEKTVAENVLKYGTGGINIDESRVDFVSEEDRKESTTKNQHADFGTKPMTNNNVYGDFSMIEPKNFNPTGRFPANLIHDNSEEVRECFPDSKSTGGTGEKSKGKMGTLNWEGQATGGFGDSGNASRFFKSIMTDSLCTLCCLPFDIKHDTMSVCNNTNVNNAEKSLKTTQATIEAIAPQNATTPDNKKFVQNVRSVGKLCDLCGTYIALVLAGEKPVHQEEEVRGQIFITEQKKQILDNALASFVELRGKKDTTLTINNLNLLFGYVFNAIENSTTYSEQEKELEKNHEKKSLIYQAKASKSERNKGCEELEEKEEVYPGINTFDESGNRLRADGSVIPPLKSKNNHPTVKPIALMEYLIKMVTRKGGIVLDPFAGSGSTLVAAKQNGFQYIGIEMTEEYIPIIEARLKENNSLFSENK